jgi:hypothetical protein
VAQGLPVVLAVGVVGLATPAYAAATITVGTCDESALDAAVAQANSDNAGDTVNTLAGVPATGIAEAIDLRIAPTQPPDPADTSGTATRRPG